MKGFVISTEARSAQWRDLAFKPKISRLRSK